MTTAIEDRYVAGEELAAAAEKILQKQFNGDRRQYAQALALAGQQNRARVEAYTPDSAGLPDEEVMSAPVAQAMDPKRRKFQAAVDQVLVQKFGNDSGRYVEAMQEVKRLQPDLYNQYAGLATAPDTAGAPPYYRAMDPALEAKGNDTSGNWPLGNNTPAPGYAPRGLLDAKVIDAQAVIRLQQLLQRAGPVTYGDLKRALEGPAYTQATAPGVSFEK